MKTYTPLQSIRRYCLWCANGQYNEVKFCPDKDCVLWPLRFGKGKKGTRYLRAIRKKCLDCSAFSPQEVRDCSFNEKLGTDDGCYLFPYRYGKRPKTGVSHPTSQQRLAGKRLLLYTSEARKRRLKSKPTPISAKEVL